MATKKLSPMLGTAFQNDKLGSDANDLDVNLATKLLHAAESRWVLGGSHYPPLLLQNTNTQAKHLYVQESQCKSPLCLMGFLLVFIPIFIGWDSLYQVSIVCSLYPSYGQRVGFLLH